MHVVPHRVSLEPILQHFGSAGIAKHVTSAVEFFVHVHEHPLTPTLHVLACVVPTFQSYENEFVTKIKLVASSPQKETTISRMKLKIVIVSGIYNS